MVQEGVRKSADAVSPDLRRRSLVQLSPLPQRHSVEHAAGVDTAGQEWRGASNVRGCGHASSSCQLSRRREPDPANGKQEKRRGAEDWSRGREQQTGGSDGAKGRRRPDRRKWKEVRGFSTEVGRRRQVGPCSYFGGPRAIDMSLLLRVIDSSLFFAARAPPLMTPYHNSIK